MADDEEFKKTVSQFISCFEEVFEQDWDYTKALIQQPGNHPIHQQGTFLNPLSKDEFNDWGSRGDLLKCYRRLRAMMKERGLYRYNPPVSPRSIEAEASRERKNESGGLGSAA